MRHVKQKELDLSTPNHALTNRAFVLGLLCVAFTSLLAPASLLIYRSSLLACDYFPLGAILPFFFIVAGVNVALKFVGRHYALTPRELTLIFMMALISTTIPTFGLVCYMLSVSSSPYYYASPENRFDEYIFPNLKSWAVVPDINNTVKWFFEGIPKGEAIPWGPWIVPVLWWVSIALMAFFMCFFLVVILRKQWMENENIAYPLTEIPLTMVEGSDDQSLLPRFMRSRIFWSGFAIPFCILLWNLANRIWPTFPSISLNRRQPVGTVTVDFLMKFPVIGFTYFVNTGAAFSIWFFWVLGLFQAHIFARLGISTFVGEPYCEGHPPIVFQEWGAFIAMVAMAVFMARGHVLKVFKKAFFGGISLDDSKELTSYRTAVWGFLICFVLLTIGLCITGLKLYMALIFVLCVLIIYIGITKIVIECGIVNLRSPMLPQVFMVNALGTSQIGMQGLTALASNYTWFSDIKSVFMPAAAHSERIRHVQGIGRREVLIALFSSMALAIGLSIWFIIYSGYQKGAYNWNTWIFQYGAYGPYDQMVRKFRDVKFAKPQWTLLLWTVSGAVIYVLLNIMRYRFTWWPLHPVGMTVNATFGVMWNAFSVFLGWACKAAILKIGGAPLYQKCRPFFIGLILGHFVGVSIAFLVDVFYFGPGGGAMWHGW
ncbi:MAG TPA: hypothetical protein PKH07_03630 [bacterium]|nr:hypothetical protein [bacterium]